MSVPPEVTEVLRHFGDHECLPRPEESGRGRVRVCATSAALSLEGG